MVQIEAKEINEDYSNTKYKKFDDALSNRSNKDTLFISCLGTSGAGKTTILQTLRTMLIKKGYDVFIFGEQLSDSGDGGYCRPYVHFDHDDNDDDFQRFHFHKLIYNIAVIFKILGEVRKNKKIAILLDFYFWNLTELYEFDKIRTIHEVEIGNNFPGFQINLMDFLKRIKFIGVHRDPFKCLECRPKNKQQYLNRKIPLYQKESESFKKNNITKEHYILNIDNDNDSLVTSYMKLYKYVEEVSK